MTTLSSRRLWPMTVTLHVIKMNGRAFGHLVDTTGSTLAKQSIGQLSLLLTEQGYNHVPGSWGLWQRQPLTHTQGRVANKMPLIHDLTDDELIAEYVKWDEKVAKATSWGASLAAASEFRLDCHREIKRRGICHRIHGSNTQ